MKRPGSLRPLRLRLVQPAQRSVPRCMVLVLSQSHAQPVKALRRITCPRSIHATLVE
jgi:hypothetical protein